MKNIFLLGECMVELKAHSATTPSTTATDEKLMAQSFAGDVINTAVYLQRSFNDINTHIITAVGKDNFSIDMMNLFNKESLGTELVFQSDDKIVGLYAIQLDETGERSFTYWRDNSAARDVMSFINEPQEQQVAAGDMLFFSGISLAVIRPDDREAFWQFVEKLKAAGLKIIFDPNYRARMWESTAQAKAQFEQAYKFSDILLPGVDDFEQLYGLQTPESIFEFCKPYGFDELVIKNGPAGVFCYTNNQVYQFNIDPVANVVDTTSAGDSFNGVYIGARAKGLKLSHAVELASKAAGFVIQHSGAIVDQCAYQQFSKSSLVNWFLFN